MRLDFNILWVEDQFADVRPQARSLATKMAAEGFELKPTICETIAEVTTRISDHVFKDDIDLILVDWDLGHDIHGEDAIAAIRQSVPYKDIVFYSGRTDIKKLRDLVRDEELEGIYFAHRTVLVDEVYGIFESLIKRTLDLDHVRGIVMGATSDIDQLARECLLAAHDLSDAAGKKEILQEMIGLLGEKVPNLKGRVDELTKDATIQGILEKHITFTANDGLRILVRVLGTDPFKQHGQYSSPIKSYMKDVVPKRNILGHKVLSPEGRPIAIAGISGETIGLDELRQLRRLLLELREKFRNLQGALKT